MMAQFYQEEGKIAIFSQLVRFTKMHLPSKKQK